MQFVYRKLRNSLWKAVELLPLKRRLPARCALMRWGLSNCEPEWLALRTLGPNRGTALDIGANRGIYAFELAKFYDRVVAFEPNSEITRELVALASPSIRLVQSGLSDAPGVRQLHTPVADDGAQLDGWSSFNPDNMPGTVNRIVTDITTVTLDSLDLTDVSFVKLDVEGHEVEVVRGGMKMLKRDRPTVLAEVRQKNLASFKELMKEASLSLSPRIDRAASDMYLFSPDL